MPTPDASQYTFIHKLQVSQESEKNIAPEKLRIVRQYFTRPIGIDALFGANALRSNKFLQDLLSLFGGGSLGSTISGLSLSISGDNRRISASWNCSPASQTLATISYGASAISGALLDEGNPIIKTSATSQTATFTLKTGQPAFVIGNIYSVNVKPTIGGVFTNGSPQTEEISVQDILPNLTALSLTPSGGASNPYPNLLLAFTMAPAYGYTMQFSRADVLTFGVSQTIGSPISASGTEGSNSYTFSSSGVSFNDNTGYYSYKCLITPSVGPTYTVTFPAVFPTISGFTSSNGGSTTNVSWSVNLGGCAVILSLYSLGTTNLLNSDFIGFASNKSGIFNTAVSNPLTVDQGFTTSNFTYDNTDGVTSYTLGIRLAIGGPEQFIGVSLPAVV